MNSLGVPKISIKATLLVAFGLARPEGTCHTDFFLVCQGHPRVKGARFGFIRDLLGF